MQLTPMKIATIAEMAKFENECFRSWLNRVDAIVGYDKRFAAGSVATWRQAFDDGNSEKGACEMFGLV